MRFNPLPFVTQTQTKTGRPPKSATGLPKTGRALPPVCVLAVDIGNTNIVLGLFRQGRRVEIWRMPTHPGKTVAAYASAFRRLLRGQRVDGAILASVVPSRTPAVKSAIAQVFDCDPMVVTHRLKSGLRVRVSRPQSIGVDRLANAAAAYAEWGGPVAVVDFGTATTFTVVSAAGDCLGGAIAPGLVTGAEALFASAARLVRVPLKRPLRAIGRETTAAMQSGIVLGHVGLVDGIVRRIEEEIGQPMRVVATGGLCRLVAPACATITDIRPNLTLEGLNLLYAMNRNPISR